MTFLQQPKQRNFDAQNNKIDWFTPTQRYTLQGATLDNSVETKDSECPGEDSSDSEEDEQILNK